MLPERLAYLALLLFEYEDLERRRLMPFKWQTCSKATSIDQVTRWLKSGRFPSVATSGEIIKSLGNDQIGTSDRKVIEDVISPPGRKALVVRIWWPPEKGPPDQEVLQGAAIEEKKHVVVGIQ